MISAYNRCLQSLEVPVMTVEQSKQALDVYHDVQLSSSYISYAVLLMLNTKLLGPVFSMSGETLAMFRFVFESLRSEATEMITKVAINSASTSVDGHYASPTYRVPLSRCKGDKERFAAYMVVLKPFKSSPNRLDLECSLALEDVQSAWNMTSSAEYSLSHALLIIHAGNRSVVIQSYYGHYTQQQWLNFEQPLTISSSMAPPAADTFRMAVDPVPKFRGILTDIQLDDLFSTLDSLTEKSEVAQAYRDVAGVIPNHKPKPFRIKWTRVDLDKMVL